ncbi:MAG: amidohydrolase family protein [Acidimicrobiia bacterium]|nr:amidohydrolase family protein [Acidimicrobiia bacterium]
MTDLAPTPRVDRLVLGGEIVTMDPERTVHRSAGIAVAGGAIVEIAASADLRRRYGDVATLDVPHGVIIPGLVDTHQHLTGDRLIRSSIPDDAPPGSAIFDWVLPVHAVHTADDDGLSATLAGIEALTNGVTTVAEAGTVAHPFAVADALRGVGIRGLVGRWGWDLDDAPFAAPADVVLDRQRELVAGLGDHGRVRPWLTLVGHDLMTDDLLVGASALARELGVRLSFHISPTTSDPDQYLARTGRRPLVHFDGLGVLGDHVVLAHAVHLDDTEADVVVDRDVAVAYCPAAYLRLGQGVSRFGRHAELHRRGVRVGLGCDTENAGDAIDVLLAARLAAGLAKDAALDPTAFGAHEALEMATIGGAAALGMADEIGSIEVGKRADLVVHDARTPSWTPRGADVALELVWAADGRSVQHVVVDGEIVVRDGVCVTADLDDIGPAATAAGAALRARAGIDAPHRWPRHDH